MGAINELLYAIDPNTMVLCLIFIILYIIIHFSLAKIFKKDRASSVIISLCISLLAIYGINKINFNFSNFFFDLGISEDIFYIIVPWIILGLAVLASFARDEATGKKRFKLYRLLLALGLMIFLIGLTPVYQRIVFIVAGIILIILGILLWKIKGVSIKRNINSSEGVDILIEEARNFKKWALRQRNPKFYGGWTYFVSYLYHKRGYPKGAKAVCNKLGISQRDFDSIFNRYGLVD